MIFTICLFDCEGLIINLLSFFIAAFTLKGNPVNSKYKRTFVLIELHSFLVKEIFDFVNHSPVFFTNLLITIFLVWAILQKWFSDYETWSELGTSYDTSSITTALVYCLFFFLLYMRFITYTTLYQFNVLSNIWFHVIYGSNFCGHF